MPRDFLDDADRDAGIAELGEGSAGVRWSNYQNTAAFDLLSSLVKYFWESAVTRNPNGSILTYPGNSFQNSIVFAQ